ncbi:unnamed protein product [Protopolystoma xenopodis]|uniref:Alpha-1,3-glucosyltransferase n=1 Tax=Protopolystoma xenopodis TaxID=117903 RepID=A0A3S5BJA6_9PLAT|nr:unnamed protein product [Protopolystoma xenopodis]
MMYITSVIIAFLTVTDMHFQYNGFLFGFLFMSLSSLLQRNFIQGSFWFIFLVNTKHTFLYIAPAFFVFILCNYCIKNEGIFHAKMFILDGKITFNFKNLFKVISTVLAVTMLSFGPFIFLGQFSQLFDRLFPFRRGLSHAYWAPNFWALYNSLDKFLELLCHHGTHKKARMTGGLVREYEHAILPGIRPLHTACITLMVIIVSFCCLNLYL